MTVPGNLPGKDTLPFTQNHTAVHYLLDFATLQQLLFSFGTYYLAALRITEGIPGLKEWFIDAILMQKPG
jgi:hypothetical protein